MRIHHRLLSELLLVSLLLALMTSMAVAHPGGTATDGCHTCRTNCERWGVAAGERHCHDKRPSDPATPQKSPRNEQSYTQAFCAQVGGQTEVRHPYTYPTGQSHIRVDCETADTVYEGGLDKRSSLDSIQQALFASTLTGKTPAVVIYDTDGKMGRFEHRIQEACERAGIEFVVFPRE